MPELAPEGPVVVVVSLVEQRVHVYRNGVRIGVSTASSGKKDFETRTGVFPILERQTEHFSNLYDEAPMPFMLRLTWSGTALHAGKIPGYPASHGCVRLPLSFAEKLFDSVRRGTIVVVADNASHPPEVVFPGWLAPVDAVTGAPLDPAANALSEIWVAQAAATEGPLSLVLSTRDRRLTVLRNGVEIGHAEAALSGEPGAGPRRLALRIDPPPPMPTPIDSATLLPAALPEPAVLPVIPRLDWQALPDPVPPPAKKGDAAVANGAKGTTPKPVDAGATTAPLRTGQLQVSEYFALQLRTVLPAVATLVVIDDPLRPPPPAPANGTGSSTAPATTPAKPATPSPAPASTPATPPPSPASTPAATPTPTTPRSNGATAPGGSAPASRKNATPVTPASRTRVQTPHSVR
jgi:hypothetical protein